MILADMDCNGFVTPSARRRKVNVFVFHAGLTFFLGNRCVLMLVVCYIELYINYKGSYFQEKQGFCLLLEVTDADYETACLPKRETAGDTPLICKPEFEKFPTPGN